MPIRIHEPSVRSLALTTFATDSDGVPRRQGSGTGFIYRQMGNDYLITNWHVLTGRDPDTGRNLEGYDVLPDSLSVMHNGCDGLNSWVSVNYQLFDEGQAQWLVHPLHGSSYDVVAMPLPEVPSTSRYPYVHGVPDEPSWIGPTTEVSIIGFPENVETIGGMGVWSRGTIATEPELDYRGLPVFLVDSRTRPGQSGSPVIVYSLAGTRVTADELHMGGEPLPELLGVYAGRTTKESDLGRVWRLGVIQEVIAGRRRDDLRRDC